MMPSGAHDEYKGGEEEADWIYEGIIAPAVELAFGKDKAVIHREVDNRKPGAITAEIVKKIASSDLAIVDITGQNPNVFLELGIRYALRKNTTILLKQNDDGHAPFDIQSLRYLNYSPLHFGPENAKKDIAAAISAASRVEPDHTDSLVFSILRGLEVNIGSEFAGGINNVRMPWKEYLRQLDKLVKLMEDNVRDGRFVPAAIMGITNGGAMFADLLAREAFNSATPVISLWANRKNQEHYFENELNNSLIKGLTAMAGEKNTLLLVDDIVASGTTNSQAIKYLKSKLSKWDIWFLPLFSRNDKYFDTIDDHIIWKHRVFKYSDTQISRVHHSDWHELPYNKDIRAT